MNAVNIEPGAPEILSRCLNGEIFIISEFLQKLELFKLVNATIFQPVERVVKPDIVRSLHANGFDEIHELVSVTQLQSLIKQSEKKLGLKSPSLFYRTIQKGFAYNKPCWVMRDPLLRIHPPYDAYESYKKDIEKFRIEYGDGRLTPLRPHRDSWFSEPKGCINIWIALTNILQGNGLSIYSDTYGRRLRYVANAGVTRAQAIGKPDNFQLRPGDALIFHAEHTHASELNRTHRSRIVLSLRISLDDPSFSTMTPGRYTKVNTNYPLTFARLHPYYGFVARRIIPLLQFKKRPLTVATDIQSPEDSGPAMNTANFPNAMDSIFLQSLVPGQPTPISQSRCVLRLENDTVYAFDRYCPHEGADLSLGHLNEQSVVCPWHNLRFDIYTGKSSCETIRDLRMQACEVVDGQFRIDRH